MAIPSLTSSRARHHPAELPAVESSFPADHARAGLRARVPIAGANGEVGAGSVKHHIRRAGPSWTMSAATVRAAASRTSDPDKRRQFLNGSDALVAALSGLRRIYSGPEAARQQVGKRGFSTQQLHPLTGADLAHWRRGDGTSFLPPGCEESARNPGVFLHPNGLAFSVSENTRRTARGNTTDLQLTFAGTTAGLNPATSSAERALGNLGAFFQQWRHNIPAHLGKETAVHEAAEDLLGATQEQIRLQGMALRPRYGKVTLVGHSLGANAALHASAVRASRDGITPVIAIDSPGVRYSPQTLAHLTTLGRKTGRTAEQLLTDAHVHIYGEGDPVVDSAHLPLSGADVHKPIATTFELPDTENRSALDNLHQHNIFDDTVFDASFNPVISLAIGRTLQPRRFR
jgi:predicted alpha/beta hydrolase family esterase